VTYACPAWEFAAETHLLKSQLQQNKVLRTNFNNGFKYASYDMQPTQFGLADGVM
jgi:hypothetical protein